MLDLEVVPQQGLQAEQWEFLLGMHFSNAVAIIQSQIGVVRSANVVYNDKTPLEHDLILDLPLDGFRLIFDSKSQRLKIIEVYNMKSVRLKYCSTPFNGPGVSPSVEQIDRCFGATRPGSYDKNRQLFALNFRGLIFYFPVDLQYQPHYSHGLGSLRFPGDASPILSKMIIYNGQNPSDAPPPPLPHAFFRGQVYAEEVIVLRTPSANRTLGLRLKLSSLTTKNVMDPLKVQVEREILFGEGVQSVVTKLGTPARVFFKSDDKMKIHSKEAHKKLNCTKSDYFFNYLTLGLDILFDAGTHTASKFILHTNFPGHYDFNSYHRCPFTLEIGRRTSPTATSASSPIIHPSLSLKMNNSVQQPHKITNNMAKLNPKPSKAKKNKNNNNQNNINNNNHQNNHNNINNNNNTNTCANNGIGNGLGIGLEEEALVEAGGGDGAVDGGIGLGLGHTVGGGGGGGGGSVNKSPSSILLGSDDPSDMSSCGGKMNGCASTISISFDSHWEEVSDFACESHDKVERPVVLTRSSSNNPFGSSLCYGVQDMIFEVMSNDHIASVTLYQNPHV